MNKKVRFLCLLPVLVLLSGCADTSSQTVGAAKPKAADEIREAEEKKPPFVGMTNGQALARYGEPKRRAVTDDGEQWVYLLNFGEAVGKALIPFNFKPTQIRTGVLTFGSDGRVKKFTWDAETNG